jgi:hypothetical protein
MLHGLRLVLIDGAGMACTARRGGGKYRQTSLQSAGGAALSKCSSPAAKDGQVGHFQAAPILMCGRGHDGLTP